MANSIKIGLVQMAMAAGRAQNAQRARQGILEAARQGATTICLPELFLSPYFCQVESAELFDLAEPIPGPTTEEFGPLAAELGVSIVLPIFERRAKGVYHNSAVVIDPAGRIAGHYRKMHIPDDPGFYEKFYFTPGDLGFVAVPMDFGRLGVLICWDQWFPEAARLTAMAGADILFYPTAIGWHPAEKQALGAEQRDAWITAQRGHAIANGVFVAAVNRVGYEPCVKGSGPCFRTTADSQSETHPPKNGPDPSDGIEFWGSSFVSGPMGQIVAQAPTDAEEVLVVEIDLDQIEATRRGWPFLRDRRIDAYGAITRRLVE